MDSDDDFDWEEVQVPEHEQHIEITLQPNRKADSQSKKKTTGISYAERLLRIDCHKLHTLTLLVNARVRNKWLNDPLLHARLLSLIPMHLQNAFAMIHKSRVPDHNQRGRMFENAIRSLVEWWTGSFFDVLPEGHVRNRTYDDIQSRLVANGLLSSPSTPAEKTSTGTSATPPDEASALISFLTSSTTPIEIDTLEDLLDDEAETIRSPKSLMKHTLMRSGSRDTSAQLFTALCRALGIPARLVTSLQSMPWQSSIGKPRPKYQTKTKGKGKAKQEEQQGTNSESDNDMEEVDISAPFAKGKKKLEFGSFPGDGQRLDGDPVQPKSEKAKGKEKAKPPIKLRKQKTKGHRLGDDPESSRSESPNPLSTPPVFWTEVFSRPDARWLPVDPIRCIVNKRKVFDPTPALSSSALPGTSALGRSSARRENRMMYVLAFEEDGYARDVTRRYAREYSTKVVKAQAGGGGRGRQLWWDMVVQTISRPYRLHRDDVEDEELEVAQLMEGMPTTLVGFKDHPLYVLERHLKQNEVIHPPPPETVELGKFRGDPVYSRSAVVPLKTAETWMRTEGRTVKSGSQPLKMIKLRASTVGKMREVEVLREAGSGGGEAAAASEVMQGLYARSQTERFVPDPVVDGIVPKNNFGNIDLYVPSMLPEGAVHVPFKGVAKIARKLGFDHAEAVTRFEFKKRRAFPVIEGVVIAKENESTLLEAYWEAEKIAEEKARAKREDQAMKRWIRLVQGLRIRKRLQDQYASEVAEGSGQPETRSPDREEKAEGEEVTAPEATPSGGGFLLEADDVVQAYSLPKYQHFTLPHESIFGKQQNQAMLSDDINDDLEHPKPEYVTYDIQGMDIDPAEDGASVERSTPTAAVPMTMQELAEAAAKKQSAEQGTRVLETVEGTSVASGSGMASQNVRVLHSQKSSRQSTPLKTGKMRRSVAPATKGRGAAKSRTAMDRTRSTRKRRQSSDESNEDSESHGNSESRHGDHLESDHDDDDDLPPKKRRRALTRSKATPVPSPATMRVLRPRRSKIQAQGEAEQEQGEVCRRATAA